MFALAIPQSEPSTERNFSTSRTSLEKIEDERPCGTPLCSAIAIVKVRVFHDIENWREGLAQHRADLRRHLNQGRPYIICLPDIVVVEALAAKNLATDLPRL